MSKKPKKKVVKTFRIYYFLAAGRRADSWQRALRKLLKILPYKCATMAAVRIPFECECVQGTAKYKKKKKPGEKGPKKR